jgi:hypothetical protein
MTMRGDPHDVLANLHELGARVWLDAADELHLDAGTLAPDFVKSIYAEHCSLLTSVLAAERRGFAWKRCDQCGAGTLTSRGSTPPCRGTSGCRGRHGGDGTVRTPARTERSRRGVSLAREGDVVHLVECDSPHGGSFTRKLCLYCRIVRTVTLGPGGALPKEQR